VPLAACPPVFPAINQHWRQAASGTLNPPF
jgi:hypothetical protein